MSLIISFAMVVLVAMAANILHWLIRGGEFSAWPTGPLGWMFNALAIAVSLTAILFLAQVFPGWAFMSLLFGYGLATSVYSLWRRHARRGNNGTSTVA